MAKILVTGARGMLGSSLVPVLQRAGHAVVTHARSGNADVLADLGNRVEVAAILARINPAVVINLAALANVDECERSPQTAYLGNVRVVENLASAIRAGTAQPHLIQISTDQVYDGVGPHAEQDLTLRNYYAFSKYAGELAAGVVPCTVLRTNFFGRSHCAARTSLSDWLVASLKEGRSIQVFEDVRFSPLSMRRLSESIAMVVARPQPGTFNLGSREGLSKADFAYVLADALGLPTTSMARTNSTEKKFLAPRPTDMRMDLAAFEHAYGLELPTLTNEILSLKTEYERPS